MRFVVAKLNRVARSAHRYLVAVASISALLACISAPVNAQGTTITVPLCDTALSTITIDTPQDNSVFNESPVTITGSVYRLTQIQVYLDGNYVSTVPLDSGATSFTTSVYINQGTNLVRLVGIDPCTPDNPEVTWKIIYAPGAAPTVQPTPPGTPPRPITQAQQAVVDSSAYLQEQVAQASQTHPAQSLSGGLYEAMVRLDMAPRNATAEQMNCMLLRMAFIVIGTVLILAAGRIVQLYRWVRYRVLGWNVHAVPGFAHRHAKRVLHIFGITLTIIPFLFLN